MAPNSPSMPSPGRIYAMARRFPITVKRHYESAPIAHRKLMLRIRQDILEIVPGAEEIVSYGMPAFKVDGNIVAGILANKSYVGFYPFSGSVLPLFEKELAKYTKTKSALHIPLDSQLPKSLLKKLIRARISQCPVKRGEVDLSKYEKIDAEWRKIGLAAPARRGLIDSKLFKLLDLKRVTRDQFKKIHGIGPDAVKKVEAAMKSISIKFRKG